MRSLKSLLGSGILVLLLIGSLTAFVIFRRKTSSSPEVLDRLIQEEIARSGYSPDVAKWFAAVSRHETAGYTSNVFNRDNNLFGMKFPEIRQTTAIGKDSSGYAVFNSPTDSVRDLVMYLNARNYARSYDSVDSLIQAMKSKGYFEDSVDNYLRGVKFHLSRLTGSIGGSGGSY
jgi:hypothetical protein